MEEAGPLGSPGYAAVGNQQFLYSLKVGENYLRRKVLPDQNLDIPTLEANQQVRN